MKERPILFSSPMIQALLNGKKTQTRRVVKPQPPIGKIIEDCHWVETGFAISEQGKGCSCIPVKCPHGYRGDLLWVRETWQSLGIHEHLKPANIPVDSDIQYPATYDGWVSKRRPSIFMPRWASRLTLEITDLRVEQLQDISDADAIEEGVDRTNTSIPGYAIERYRHLWTSINGNSSWDENPWVWVIFFKVHQNNVDELLHNRTKGLDNA